MIIRNICALNVSVFLSHTTIRMKFIFSSVISFFARIISFFTDLVFVGSKSIITPKRRPIVTAVNRFSIADYNIRGLIFSPRQDTERTDRSRFSCFPDGLRNVIQGKLQYYHDRDDRTRVEDFLINLFVLLCSCLPDCILPKVRNCFEFDDTVEMDGPPLPLILWSHGRGGNVHDHAMLCSELASQVPAIVVSITHTDGTADFFQRVQRGRTALYQHLKASVREDEKYLGQLVEMREYQIKYRMNELLQVIEFMKNHPTFNINDKIVVGGFELGAATAAALANKNLDKKFVGLISLDGLFSIEDKFKFPRGLFESPALNCPAAFVLSDEWSVWNKPVTDNTEKLFEMNEKNGKSRLVTLKQTNHLNLTECMFWVPLLFVRFLRLSGIVHRRGDPRKTYRRMTKWLVSVVQQYVNDSSDEFRVSPEL